MPSGLSASDAIFDLGKNKRVTVRQFRNINLIDIREYYLDSSTGEMKPGKKGISLTEDLYDELLKHRLNIDEALRRLGSKRPKTKMVRLLSDDEYEDDNNNDTINNDKDKNSSKKRREDKSKSSNENQDLEPRSKKKKPAPPTLLPHEENIQNAEREANATLIIPGQAGRKQQEERKQKEKEEEEEKAKAKAKAEAKENILEPQPEPEPAPVPMVQAKKEDALSNIDDAKDANSSDEEFAQSLEAEMNKAEDDISEEE